MTEADMRDQLFARLTDVAQKLRTPRALSDHDLAVAFLGVGIELARASVGAALAAEWLRDVADVIERPALDGNDSDGACVPALPRPN